MAAQETVDVNAMKKEIDSLKQELKDMAKSIKDSGKEALKDAKNKIDGVAISSPGAVNKKTGVIEGASALPYIHNFKIVPELEKNLACQ